MLEIAGIIVTVVIGGLSLWFSYWLIIRKKRPCEILFLAIDCINVYNKFSLDFESLEIKTKGEKIDNDLLFFSGVFVCNGYKDIQGENNQLAIQLPKECKWKDIKISSLSKDLTATIGIDQETPSKSYLSFGQFRMKEFVTIKGLIECKDQKLLKKLHTFHKQIDFFHRIQETEKVKIGVIIEWQMKMWQHILRQIPFMITIILTIFMMTNGASRSPISYQCPTSKKLFMAQVSESGNVLLRDKTSVLNFFGNNEQEIPAKKFKEQFKVVTKYEKYDNIDIITFVLWGILDLVMMLYLCYYNRQYFRNRKRVRMYIGER